MCDITSIVVSSTFTLLAALFGALVGGFMTYKVARWQAAREQAGTELREAELRYGELLHYAGLLSPNAPVNYNFSEGLLNLNRAQSQLRWLAPKDVKSAIDGFFVAHKIFRDDQEKGGKQLKEKLAILKQLITADIDNKFKKISSIAK